MGKDIRSCQAKLADYCEDLKEKINRKLYTKGVTVYNFVISKLSYEPQHEAKRKALGDAKINVAINHVGNAGKLDDLDVVRKAADIDIDYIKANKAPGEPVEPRAPRGPVNSGEYVFCSRCGERNVKGTNYCGKCGEKLNK